MYPEQKIIIRKAETKDADLLSQLARAGFPGYPFLGVYQPEIIRQQIQNGEQRYVLETEMGLVATAVLGGSQQMREICRVVVSPQYRGNGVGKAITKSLYDEATINGWSPWADVRAVQPAMQRSALSAGMYPVSVESGKHVVYDHRDQNDHPTSPARESMIHFTSLIADPSQLRRQLNLWPLSLKQVLLTNIKSALNLSQPDRGLAHLLLPDAQSVKSKIHSELQKMSLATDITRDSDIEVIDLSGNKVLIIKPDASAFILENNHPGSVDLNTLAELGIQVVTAYCDAGQIDTINSLARLKMEPAMLRPWRNEIGSATVWQVGCRRFLNQGHQLIEPVNIDPQIRSQLEQFFTYLT